MDTAPNRPAGLLRQALVAAALADGSSIIAHVPTSDDIQELIDALDQLGTPIRYDRARQRFEITGGGGHWPNGRASLHFSSDSTTMHLITAACSIGPGQYRIDADGPLRDQPIQAFADALIDLGAAIACDDRPGYPPLTLRASGLSGGNLRLTADDRAVGALLLVAPFARTDVFIELNVDMPLLQTCGLMQTFGVQVIAGPDNRFIVPAHQRYRATRYDLPHE